MAALASALRAAGAARRLALAPPGGRAPAPAPARSFGSLLRKNREALGLHVPRGTATLDKWHKESPVSQVRAQIAEAAQRRDWQAARGAFDAVEAPVTPVWEAILHAADRCERLADAEELFGRMRADRSCRLRVRSFNSMVNLNSRRGDVGRVEELLATMRAESIRPDAMLYSAILNGYARSGDVEAATRAWQEMLDAGIRPTSVSYVSLLNVLAEAKLPDLAVARVEEMSACGLVPQVQHWNAVLKACQRAPDSEAALRNLARMKERGAAPNVVSYTAVLLAVVRSDPSGCGAAVDALLEGMARDGVEPDGHFYETRAIARLGAGTTEEALAALRAADRGALEAVASDFREAGARGAGLSTRAARLAAAVEDALGGGAGGAAADWVEVQAEPHGTYFWNRATGATQWERPAAGSIPRVHA